MVSSCRALELSLGAAAAFPDMRDNVKGVRGLGPRSLQTHEGIAPTVIAVTYTFSTESMAARWAMLVQGGVMYVSLILSLRSMHSRY